MANPTSNPSGMDASLSSLNSVDNDISATSSANIDTQPSKWTSASTSLTPSPLASRDSSPTRSAPVRPGKISRTSTSGSISRKNSTQESSPSRSKSNIPTPSTTPKQHQLSSMTTPTLLPPNRSEPALSAPVPQKSSAPSDPSLRWPVSPRLKSPPPHLNKPTVPPPSRRNETSEPPSINVQRATPVHSVDTPSQPASDNEVEDAQLQTGMRTPARGPSPLETVQEVSQPNSPNAGLDAAIEKLEQTAAAQALSQNGGVDKSMDKTNKKEQGSQNAESGSDSGSTQANTRRSSAQAPPPLLHSRQSSTALKFGGRGQMAGESSSRNMTVETEEVKNMQKLSLAPTVGLQGANGSLRTKPSNETIKPKKEKKRHTRKPAAVASGTGETPYFFATNTLRHSRSAKSFSSMPPRSPVKPSVGQGPHSDDALISSRSRLQPQGRAHSRAASITAHVTNLLTGGNRTASSKADIFEAKVASAVEEANSSDSDETFVYDSNPPDVSERPRRFHSRTPSAASMVSQADRSGMRSIHGVLENSGQNVPVKKNMKFVNSFNNLVDGGFGDDDGRGSGRSHAGSARATGRHHHPGGRWNRNNPNHTSLFDNESPFLNPGRAKFNGSNFKQPSNPPSPRFSSGRGWMSSKRHTPRSTAYDMDDTTGADDESTPLLMSGTVRSTRSSRSRRAPLPSRNIEAQTYRRRPSFLNRFASCLVLTIMLLLVITGAIGFMFATSQPLTDIKLVKISNVLASEQELMMDVSVKAHNPNVVVVMVDSADLEIFAKSPHAGTDSDWWRHPDGNFGDDFGTLDDPIEDPPNDDTSPNMRLGNILAFDSPLSYEGSFFQSGISVSTGSLRLTRPGNDTTSGSERWERIISDEFTLIIKGVLKYTLPLSQRVRSVSIAGRTTVKPNSANDPTLAPPNGTEIGIPF